MCMTVYDCVCTSIYAKDRRFIQARDPCQKSSSLPHLLREGQSLKRVLSDWLDHLTSKSQLLPVHPPPCGAGVTIARNDQAFTWVLRL